MKAVAYTTYGLPEVLQLKEVEKPTPKDHEVLIRIGAASVNSWDWDLLRGKPWYARLGGLLKPKYSILGADVAGTIEAVGIQVTQFQPGDEVFGDISGCSWGGFAEYVCADEKALALKSPHMTFEQAAAVPQAAVLALQGLRMGGLIQARQKVLINGAGGGVGTFAIQMAKSWGAEVTGVDKGGKLDRLRSIGADHVIDYTQEDFTRNGQQYDLILDVVALRSLFDHMRALTPKGIYVLVGGTTSAIFQTLLLGSWMAPLRNRKLCILVHKPNPTDLKEINRFFETGQVVPVIDKCYPLPETAEAIRYLGEGHAQGKVVIQISS